VPAFDKLSIDTPEQVALDFSLASIGSRFLALAIDSLIQLGVSGLLLLLALVAGRIFQFALDTVSPWILAALILGWFLVYYGYFAAFEVLWNGQTPGKRVIGLRVISVTGRPISAYEAILRNVVRIADQMPGIYAIGIISVFVTERSQRLGDLAAGTVVVHERAVEAVDMEPRADPPVVTTRHGAARLAPEEIAVVELFFRRRDQLGNYDRSRVAAQIADRIRPRLGITEKSNNERFLEEVVAEYRDRNRYR
jgi:uncharacterized RDD family membrane protein YckC